MQLQQEWWAPGGCTAVRSCKNDGKAQIPQERMNELIQFGRHEDKACTTSPYPTTNLGTIRWNRSSSPR